MPQRSNQFQRLITLINAGVSGNAKVTESALLPDSVTGDKREVDVLIESEISGYDLKIGIEVVSYKRRADVTWVEKMRAKHECLPTNKLILVSESGFSSQAILKAGFYDIDTLTIEEAIDSEWELSKFLTETGRIEIISFKKAAKGVVVEKDGSNKSLIEIPLSAKITSGENTATIDNLIEDLLRDQRNKQILQSKILSGETDFWFSLTREGGLWDLKAEDGSIRRILELRISLTASLDSIPINFRTGAYNSRSFVAGVSSDINEPLEFAIVRSLEGSDKGYMLSKFGLNTMQVDEDFDPNS